MSKYSSQILCGNYFCSKFFLFPQSYFIVTCHCTNFVAASLFCPPLFLCGNSAFCHDEYSPLLPLLLPLNHRYLGSCRNVALYIHKCILCSNFLSFTQQAGSVLKIFLLTHYRSFWLCTYSPLAASIFNARRSQFFFLWKNLLFSTAHALALNFLRIFLFSTSFCQLS